MERVKADQSASNFSSLALTLNVFIASLCTLIIEIVAGRVLAPYVGNTIFTWSSIIGIVLAALSIGAYLGGRLADSKENGQFKEGYIGLVLMAAGIAVLFINPISTLFEMYPFLFKNGLTSKVAPKTLIMGMLLFFIPCALLGMVTPLVLKQLITNFGNAGTVIGQVSALGTIGSIIGTFLTGFVFVMYFRSRSILLLTGLTLVTFSIITGGILQFLKLRLKLGFLGISFITFLVALNFYEVKSPSTILKKDTNYYSMKLNRKLGGEPRRELLTLYFDRVEQSITDLKDPSYLAWDHLKMLSAYLGSKMDVDQEFKVLCIGGGGFTLPRFLQYKYKNVSIDIIEIDPEVSRIAINYLGFAPGAKTRIFHEDARWYAMNPDREGVYDLIFYDAFSGYSLPYHLASTEFVRSMHKMLNPSGVLFANLVENYLPGRFWSSYVATWNEVFPVENISLWARQNWYSPKGPNSNTLLVGFKSSNEALWTKSWLANENKLKPFEIKELTAAELKKEIESRRAVAFTDSFNPSEIIFYLSVPEY